MCNIPLLPPESFRAVLFFIVPAPQRLLSLHGTIPLARASVARAPALLRTRGHPHPGRKAAIRAKVLDR